MLPLPYPDPRFDVAVDHVPLVGVVQGRGRLFQDGDGLLEREPTLFLQQIGKGATFEELHGVPEEPAARAYTVDGDDVWVIERRGSTGFALEAIYGPSTEREVGREHLDGHLAAEVCFGREVHDGHAAAAEFAVDLELAAHLLADQALEFGGLGGVHGRGGGAAGPARVRDVRADLRTPASA